jgi:hypothetical protein
MSLKTILQSNSIISNYKTLMFLFLLMFYLVTNSYMHVCVCVFETMIYMNWKKKFYYVNDVNKSDDVQDDDDEFRFPYVYSNLYEN